MLDRLLQPRDLRADLVIAALDGRHALAHRAMERTLALDRGLGGALVRERGLHLDFPRARSAVVHLRAAVELLQPQREQLRGETALLLFEGLIAPCRGGLAMQMPDLLLHLIAHVLQALE